MMELAEENGFAGQALSAQPDFSARNALSRIIRCLLRKNYLMKRNLRFSVKKVGLITASLMENISFS